MSNIRIFQFSCELFSGYKVSVDLDKVDNMNEVITYCVKNIRDFLKNNGLEVLVNKLDKINYHIHDTSFEDVLLSEPNNKPQFYICNHGCYGFVQDKEDSYEF